MSRKSLITIGMIIGSIIGGYIPMIWGASFLSYTSLLLSAVCSLLGIWIMFKLTE